jgi:hypothetical protein
VRLTTTGASSGSTGPGIHGVSRGAANAATVVFVGRTHPASP